LYHAGDPTMKMLSETAALEKVGRLKDEFRALVASVYEPKAKPCSSCGSPGACCLDAHFVNVRISRLEAVAIARAIESFGPDRLLDIYRRINDVVRRFGLDGHDEVSTKTYACPLYESGVGCLVHDTAKPLPCIHHACYENKEDLPPEELLESADLAVDSLNKKVYGRSLPLLPLPIAIRNVSSRSKNRMPAA
jgi:hypothetical protein